MWIVSAGSLKMALVVSMRHVCARQKISLQIYNTLSFPLLCREQNEKFTDLENEFRIIAYDCPRIQNGIMQQKPREATILGKTGMEYKGVLNAGIDSIFKSKA